MFVSGNMPFKTEIAPVLIVARLEEFAYAEATAIAVVLLVISFAHAGADQSAGAVEQAVLCITQSHDAPRSRTPAQRAAHRDPPVVQWGLTLAAVLTIVRADRDSGGQRVLPGVGRRAGSLLGQPGRRLATRCIRSC